MRASDNRGPLLFMLILAGPGMLLVAGLSSCSLGGGGITPIRTSFNRGVYHYSREHYDAAIAEFQRALKEDAADYRARFNLGLALEAAAREAERAGDEARARELRQRAEREYRNLLADRPNVRATVNLAALEYDRGAREEARKRLREAIEEDPRQVAPRLALAARLLGEIRELSRESAAQARAAKLLRLLDETLELDSSSVEGNMLHGETHLLLARGDGDGGGSPASRERHTEAARAAFTRALRRDPSDIPTLLALGRLEKEEGNHEDARVWFQRVLFIDEDHLESHVQISESLESLGELEMATWHLWQARQLDGRPPRRLAPEEYRRRLLDLYRRLTEKERG